MRAIKFLLFILVFASCTKSVDSTTPQCGEFLQLWYKKNNPTPDTMQRYYLAPGAMANLSAQGEDGKIVIKNDTLTVIHKLIAGPCK